MVALYPSSDPNPRPLVVDWLYVIAPVLFVVAFFLWDAAGGLVIGTGSDLVGRDYINVFGSGRLVWEGTPDVALSGEDYQTSLESRFGLTLSHYAYSYPPHMLLVNAFFAAFPYTFGLILWSVGGVTAFLLAARPSIGRADRWLLALCPAVLVCLWAGQTGLWLSALLIFALRFETSRPLLAGVCLALMTVKPQLGPIILVWLIARQSYGAIAFGALFTGIFVGASLLFLPHTLWQDFVHSTLPHQMSLLVTSIGIFDIMVPSAFRSLVLLGFDTSVAWAAQFAVSLAAMIAAFVCARRCRTVEASIACVGSLAFLTSPYIAVYDLPVLAVAGLVAAAGLPGVLGAMTRVMAIACVAFAMLGAANGIPLGPVVIVAVAFLCVASVWVNDGKLQAEATHDGDMVGGLAPVPDVLVDP